jgi:hypothetical protein
MKKCGNCKIEKPLEDFSKHPHGKHGLNSKCKDCIREYDNDPINKQRRLSLQRKRRRTSTKTKAVAMLSEIARSSRKKGVELNIRVEWIEDKLRNGVCEATGIPFVLNPEKSEFTVTTKLNRMMNPFAPSVERVDSLKGYTEDNCIITVLIYNYAKNSFSEEAVEMFCRAYLNKLDNE